MVAVTKGQMQKRGLWTGGLALPPALQRGAGGSAMWVDHDSWQGKAYSGGWRDLGGERIQVLEPATGETLIEVAAATPRHIAEAAVHAKRAQAAWAATPFRERAEIFRRAASLLNEEVERCATWIIRETGAIPPKASFEIESVVNLLHEAAALQTAPQGLILPSQDRTSLARRIPHGVVGIITPFNFPFLLSCRSLAPALACGNAVVLKPDPRTPISGGFLLAALFERAGLPSGLLHVLPGGVDVGEALVTDPNVAMISFTGSTRAGRRVGALAGGHLKKVALELGGKNTLIVLDDADLELALGCAAWASWLHQGQICMSAGRHVVHRSLVEAYGARMAAKADALPVGDPHREQVTIGPLITETQAIRVDDLVQASIAMGARLLAGGSRRGRYYAPTVLADVRPDMPVFKEEIFGPVVSITAFDSDEEAIAHANDTEYGLSAGILTASVSRGLEIAGRLNVGLVHVNDQTVNDDGLMPMGGRGASGNGSRHGGPANLDEFTQWQWQTFRAAPPPYPL